MPQLLALAVLGTCLALPIRYPDVPAATRNLVADVFMAMHPARPDAPITIVDIDETSLAAQGAWPWPLPVLQTLIEQVGKLGGRPVALVAIPVGRRTDATSCEPPPADIATAAGRPAPPVSAGPLSPDHLQAVIGFALTEGPGEPRHPPRRVGLVTIGVDAPRLHNRLPASLLPADEIMQQAAGIGALNVFPDRDGRVRRVPLLVQMGDTLYPSLVAEMLRLASGGTSYQLRLDPIRGPSAAMSLKIGDAVIPLNDNGEVWLHYAPDSALPRVSAASVIAGKLAPDALRDRLVLIGVSAPGIGARAVSPLGEQLTPAAIHAQALAQLLTGTHPVRPAWAPAAELIVAALGALLLILISFWRRGLWVVVPGTLLVAGVIAGAYALFVHAQLLVDPLYPVAAITAAYVSLLLASYVATERERRWVQRAFSSYVSPVLVQHLIRHPEQLRLVGERRECSFVMTDLAGFTPLVEAYAPEELVELLNRYLDRLIAVVFEHEGAVDRIVGDAVSVRFSAPVYQPDHAQRAYDCALAIDRAAVEFAAAIQRDGVPFGQTRIGVHTGEVIVGNFGGTRQLDYRAFGDPINTAARLESANRFFGTRLAVSAATLACCGHAEVRPIGALLLKGKTEPIDTFTPVTPEQIRSGLAEHYRAAYRAIQQDAGAALAAFEAVAARFPTDALTRFHVERLRSGLRDVVIRLDK